LKNPSLKVLKGWEKASNLLIPRRLINDSQVIELLGEYRKNIGNTVGKVGCIETDTTPEMLEDSHNY